MIKKRGITIAGNLIADIVKNIDVFPKTGMMAYVSEVIPAVGGCVPNTAIDLARIDGELPLTVCGKLGNDENGRFILNELQKNGIDISGISFSEQSLTSFCDVMNLPGGERTFFHKKGANAEFSPADIDISALSCDIFHIGYILLLDSFDKEDSEYGTVMARFLAEVQKKGIKTSVDVVSSSSDDYGAKIIPALGYCNYFIVNEIECCTIWGMDAYNADGSMNCENIRSAMEKCVECGVSEKVIVHSKALSFILDSATGGFLSVPSLSVPTDAIKGSVGAGDAFCAGCLYGLYQGYTDRKILEFASCAAACSLFEANSVDGMRARDEILALEEKYGRQELRVF